MKEFIRVKNVIFAVEDIRAIIKRDCDCVISINNMEIPYDDKDEMEDVFNLITERLDAYLVK